MPEQRARGWGVNQEAEDILLPSTLRVWNKKSDCRPCPAPPGLLKDVIFFPMYGGSCGGAESRRWDVLCSRSGKASLAGGPSISGTGSCAVMLAGAAAPGLPEG